MSAEALCFGAVRPPRLSVPSSGQILLLRYLANGLRNLKTYVEYSLAPTYDLIRFWRSKVAKALTLMLSNCHF